MIFLTITLSSGMCYLVLACALYEVLRSALLVVFSQDKKKGCYIYIIFLMICNGSLVYFASSTSCLLLIQV
jgi:hypothetical protein